MGNCLTSSNKSNDINIQIKNNIIDFNVPINECTEFLKNEDVIVRVISIYDGDTFKVLIKIDNKFYKWSVRLNGIDTCEMRAKNQNNKNLAIKAKLRLYELITNKKVDIKTYNKSDGKKKLDEELQNNIYIVKLTCNSFDKYGRILANAYNINNKSSFSDILINEKLGYKYDGNTKLSEDEQLVTVNF